jgi:hypothetical protein
MQVKFHCDSRMRSLAGVYNRSRLHTKLMLFVPIFHERWRGLQEEVERHLQCLQGGQDNEYEVGLLAIGEVYVIHPLWMNLCMIGQMWSSLRTRAPSIPTARSLTQSSRPTRTPWSIKAERVHQNPPNRSTKTTCSWKCALEKLERLLRLLWKA